MSALRLAGALLARRPAAVRRASRQPLRRALSGRGSKAFAETEMPAIVDLFNACWYTIGRCCYFMPV